ncbi:hypothetical protein SPBR_05900 [Sporothrix brasiliensis 5110]|uniref:Rhodopsin domain-containing protein n=1 Tax=Sporothrix brasiliensis 5110 TaxID=1398154 RepID=A0A0C2JBY1_9PEZI|nr:uncharacterized protein SPBR_05900 [Sporothrix brasiliensis 5110]KIH94417.1 hypothetical protein SPBR_05900 [Sporothrix brasiliensis 5110]
MYASDGHYSAASIATQAVAASSNGMHNKGTEEVFTSISAFISRAMASTAEYPTSPLQQFGFAIIVFFPVLAFIIVMLRVYSRVSTKQFGIDDTLIIIAMILSIGETASTWMFMKTNFIAIHIWDVPREYDVVQALIWNFAVQVLYNPILALVKTSMLLFLLKLGSQKPGVRICIHILNALNLMLMVAIFIVVIFQCTPIRFNWDTTIVGGHCINQGVFYLATAALTIFTDVLNLALPFWVFLDLKMPVRVKIALLFVFLLGGIVTVVGIVRLVFIYDGFFTAPGPDPTYSLGFCTSAIETNLAIICASAPSLRGLVRSWFPRFFSSNRPAYDYRYPDSNGYGGGRRGTNNNNPYGTSSVTTNIAARRNKENGIGPDNGPSTDGLGANAAGASRRGVGGTFALRDLKGGSKTHTAVNSSPSASEEEIMTYNGIVRTTNVQVHYDGSSERKGSTNRDRSGDRGSSMGMRTSISGSL